MTQAIKRADAFAALAHGSIDQRRRYTDEPYVVHPRAVAALVRTVPHTEEMLIAALLHDVIEDTPFTYADVRSEFGGHVAAVVDQLTERRRGANRSERKRFEVMRLARATREVKTIKLADLIDNAGSIVAHDPGFARVYLAEMQRLLFALEGGDEGLLVHAWRAVEDGWRTLATA